jgi:hypothetical protein
MRDTRFISFNGYDMPTLHFRRLEARQEHKVTFLPLQAPYVSLIINPDKLTIVLARVQYIVVRSNLDSDAATAFVAFLGIIWYNA